MELIKYCGVCVFLLFFPFISMVQQPPPPTPPSEPGLPHYRGFTITLRRTTIDRTSLDEWSARRGDTTLLKDIHPYAQRDSNPQSQQAIGPQTHALDRVATGILFYVCGLRKFLFAQIASQIGGHTVILSGS